MAYIYSLSSLFLLATMSLLFYQKILGMKPKLTMSPLVMSFVFACILWFSVQFSPLPTRELISIPLLALILWLWQRKINWAGLILAFLISYSVWIISIIVAIFVGHLLGTLETDFHFLVMFIAETLLYFTLYRFLRLKDGAAFVQSRGGKAIIFTSVGSVITTFSVLHLMAEYVNLPFLFATWLILGVAILAIALSSIHFSKRYIEETEQQKQVLVEQKRMLEREQHNYQQVVPAVRWTNAYVLENIKSITETGDVSKLKEMEHYLNLVGEVNMELSEEFSFDDLVKEYRGFTVPEQWLALKTSVLVTMAECERKGIFAFAQNTATTWEQIEVRKVMLIRLVGNLLKNAVRELGKTAHHDKELSLRFYDAGNFFAIDVSDTAHPFPIPILARLGERGNSTNNTGDGYAEIFDFLTDSGASLIITETREDGYDRKTITLVFDKLVRVIVRSDHRYEELKVALEGTELTVEHLSEELCTL